MPYTFNPFTGTMDFYASGGGLTVGTTTISGGSTGRVLYNNGGVLGEYANTGTAGNNVLSIAPTLTGPVTLNEAVGSSGLTITGATQTSAAVPALNITQTWNGAGLGMIGVSTNITVTAADNTASQIERWRINGTTVAYIGRFGQMFAGAHYTGSGTTATSGFDANGCVLNSSRALAWASTSDVVTGGLDTYIVRDAANTVALRNSTNAQTFRVYNTYTDASNGEWWTSNWASNVYHMGATKNGSGTSRAAQWDYGTTTTSAITVPSAITGTVVIAGGSVGATTALTLGGATQTATSGTYINTQVTGTYNPSSTSTMVAVSFYINPTINYSAGTPGAGSYEALKIAAVETALPTGGSYLIRASSGATGFTDRFLVEAAAGAITACAGTAIPAGGTTGAGMKVSTTANFGVFFGSGAPSLSAAKGSLYLRSDGSGTTNRAYVNTDGGTTWTAVTTVA